MEKIIFFALAVPILGFVFYLGGSAIMKGFKAKVDNRPVKSEEKDESETQVSQTNSNDLSNEISKLNEALSKALSRLVELESKKEASAGCVECVDADLRKKLAQWNPKLGQRL